MTCRAVAIHDIDQDQLYDSKEIVKALDEISKRLKPDNLSGIKFCFVFIAITALMSGVSWVSVNVYLDAGEACEVPK